MTRLLPAGCALAVAGCLLFAAPAPDAAAEPVRPSSAAGPAAEAGAPIGGGRFDEALAVLRPLARDRSANGSVLFQLGLAAVGASRKSGLPEPARKALLDEAIGAFRAMLVKAPGLVRVRLELARAFFLKGEDSLAKRHFEQALAGDLPAGVAANIHRYLQQIRARKRWSAHVGAALAPDTNIGAGSAERIIYIYGLPFHRTEDELTRSGVGLSLWTGGEYQYPLGPRHRLRAGGDLSRQDYQGSRFDRTTVAGHVGPRWLASGRTEASLLVSARRRWQAGDPDHRDLGLRAEALHRLGARTTGTVQASWHERRYDDRGFLDGPVVDISAGAMWTATPVLRVDATFGWGRERPGTETWRQTRLWLQAGVTAALPRGFTVGGSATLRRTRYEGDWFPYTAPGESRRDETRGLRLSVHNRAFTLGGFSPRLSVGVERRTTNAQICDYERSFAELGVVRLF